MLGCFQSKSFKVLLKNSISNLILSFLVLFFIRTNAFAKVEKISDIKEETLEQKFINSNIAISKWFDSLAEGIDLFLVGEQLQKGRNETNVKVENSTYSVEGKNLTNQTSFIINPRLPNLEKYWNLKFTTYDEQNDERSAEKHLLRQTPRETNYGATLGLFKKLGRVRTSFQPRIELQNPLKISHSLAFETIADYQVFMINPKLNFFANATRGTGVFQAINFNFTLTKIFSLTLINEGTYEEKLNKYSVTNGFSIGQSISDKNAMAYSFLLFSNNRDNYHLDAYSLSATWYHLFYKKILDLKLTPYLNFNNSLDFKGQPGLTLQLTLNF